LAKRKNKQQFKSLMGFQALFGAFCSIYILHWLFGWSTEITAIPFYAYLIFWFLNTINPFRKKHVDINSTYYLITLIFLILYIFLFLIFLLIGFLAFIYNKIDWEGFFSTDLGIFLVIWFSLTFLVSLYSRLSSSTDDVSYSPTDSSPDEIPNNPYTPFEDKNLLIQNIIEITGKNSWKAELEKLDVDTLNTFLEKLSRGENLDK
jgi:hypothetical protein